MIPLLSSGSTTNKHPALPAPSAGPKQHADLDRPGTMPPGATKYRKLDVPALVHRLHKPGGRGVARDHARAQLLRTAFEQRRALHRCAAWAVITGVIRRYYA